MNKLTLSITMFFVLTSLFALPVYAGTWTETTFADFADGWFDAGGNIVASPDGKLTLTGQQWDLNNDGFLDIVFSNYNDGATYIYWGSASGFSSDNKTELPTHGASGNSVADFNSDGFLDIVFSNVYDGMSYNINSYIYWGSASGFSSSNKTELPTHGAYGNSVADLNGDGFLDIVFCNYYDGTSYNINSYIYWGSAGGFSSGNRTELPTHGAYGNSVADLNGDGFLDIVFSNSYDGTSYNINSYIYWGSASGFSSANKTELPTHRAICNSVADLNSDGFLDIVFSNDYNGTSFNINSYIYWGSASGFSSSNKTELPTHGACGNSVADLNGDGFLDIVFSNGYDGTSWKINSVIYWGSANGFSSGNKTELPTHCAYGNSVADLNDDSFPDIIFSNAGDGWSGNINSYIYWGSAGGFSSGNKTELPTHSAYESTTKDLGDAYTRQPEFVYISSAYDTGAASSFGALSWVAQTPEGTYAQFQIRTADTQAALDSASWYGPTGTSDRYTVPGTPINPIHSGNQWVQYQVFLGTNYANTPILDSVMIDYTSGAPDTIPPSAITNLATSNPTSDSITLTWTAPGDDGNVGTATTYDIRYSKEPITDANWDVATQCQGEPSPHEASANETFTVTNLEPGTIYYFAMKTADEVQNWSPLSNVVQGTTAGECILGDIDGNGLVLINDAVLLLKHIADPEGNPFDERQLCAGDMDGNGIILINDAVLLLKKIAEGAPNITLRYSSDTEAKIIISELKAKEGTIVKLMTSSAIGGLSINLKYQNARLLDIKTFGLSAVHQDSDVIKIAWLNSGDGRIAEIAFEGKPILNAEEVYVSDLSGNLISADIIHNPVIDRNLLFQNYPNPFNPETWIPFQIKESSDVTIAIYNQKGHLIRRISLGKKEAGMYIKKDGAVYWDGRNEKGEYVAGGVYFYTISAGQFKDTKKMVILK